MIHTVAIFCAKDHDMCAYGNLSPESEIIKLLAIFASVHPIQEACNLITYRQRFVRPCAPHPLLEQNVMIQKIVDVRRPSTRKLKLKKQAF